MRFNVSGALAAILLIGTSESHAAVMTFDAAARGWVFANGIANGRAAANNTFTGWGADTSDVNSWFGFDLSTVSGTIIAAELLLDVDDYVSPDASETLVLRHVATLAGQLGTVDSVAHFNDLMTGTIFGSRTFTDADPGHLRAIPLNAAGVADVDAAIGGILGSRGASFDVVPLRPLRVDLLGCHRGSVNDPVAHHDDTRAGKLDFVRPRPGCSVPETRQLKRDRDGVFYLTVGPLRSRSSKA